MEGKPVEFEAETSRRREGAHHSPDLVGEARPPVGCQAHHLVFPLVDLEPAEGGEGRVEEAERVRVAHLRVERQLPAAAGAAPAAADGRRRPLADAVDDQHRRLVERRREERARRVREVVLAVENLARFQVERALQPRTDPKPLVEPSSRRAPEQRPRGRERVDRAGEDARQLAEGLFVEDDRVEVPRLEARARQAPARGVLGQAAVVLDAREALLRRGGDGNAVHDQRRGRVVVVEAQAENLHPAPSKVSRAPRGGRGIQPLFAGRRRARGSAPSSRAAIATGPRKSQ